MPKFKVLKDGVNEELLASVREKVDSLMVELFDAEEVLKMDDISSFDFGTATVSVRVIPWHSEDVLVEVYSFVAKGVTLTQGLAEELLRLNALQHFGAFGYALDSVVFTYSLAGANLDKNELVAAIQSVAAVADEYDEILSENA